MYGGIMRKRALKLHAKDNCVVALNDIASGDIVWWDEGKWWPVVPLPGAQTGLRSAEQW